MALDLDVSETPDGVTLHVSGALDITTADRFRRAATGASAGGKYVRLDLGDVDFMDSSGITGLVDVVKRGEGRVTISDNLRPEVRRVLSITGIIRTLPMHPASGA